MIKYCSIANSETGLVNVAQGTNIEYYQSIGMIERNVEQSDVDNNWYLTEKCPHKSEEEQAEEREAEFKSKFFEIPNHGWFRKVPKGYSSAAESLNSAFNAVSILGKLPASTLIFYEQPDFTKPEECTEEWLIEHQTTNEEMTVQEFGAFYMAFVTAWNAEEHEGQNDL